MIHTDTLSDRLRRLNWLMLLLVFGFCFAGTMMMVSAGAGNWSEYATYQMVRYALGLACMTAIMLCPPTWLHRFAYLAFAVMLSMLIAVEVMGHIGMGAQRWLKLGGMMVQPSEFMKLALIVALARFYHNAALDETSHIKNILVACLMIGLPAILILKQPNLGTATVTVFIGVSILFLAGVSWKYFAAGTVSIAAGAPLAWQFLHDYQKTRVLTFLDPEKDPLGAGYNIIQSQIAIGSGGMWGKGYLDGSQAQLNFLPEKHTDFIFTMLAEEWGFVGSIIMLLAYACILIYGLMVAAGSRTIFGRLVAGGVTAFLFAHIFINVAMVMGILPVVGLPLPLLSYGGSITLTSLMALGLLLNVGINKDQQLLFRL